MNGVSGEVSTLPIRARLILLDIEGTTSSISFVYDVMFPFVRSHLNAFLRQHWDTEPVRNAAALIATEAGRATFTIEETEAEVYRLMDSDVKSTGLKRLQGLVWRSGFESGELIAHVYEDVPRTIERWKSQGLEIRIYSSGSVEAQKLFFGNSTAGNLLPNFSGHYDTTTGPKRESHSYRLIASDCGISAAEILFVSDVVAELDAAAMAGMQTRLSLRPGNPDQPQNAHVCVHSFDEILVGI